MEDDMFRPPVNRAMRVLDRSFFRREYPISAAKVYDVKSMSKVQRELVKSREILHIRAIAPVQPVPTEASSDAQKCIILRPELKHNDRSTWSDSVTRLVGAGDVGIIPFNLALDYESWTANEILFSVLPEELLDEVPTGFNPIGHIAQMNLRDPYLPYKSLIGQVIMDKNPTIRTVVNKKETLGEENEFRVLEFELIAGEPDYEVEMKEHNSTFRFAFDKVFWNSRLNTEHRRLIDTFKKGEAVCDVMAGVGPFAIPAAKNGVFVWANDLNPHCYHGLKDAVSLNKVEQFVQAYNEDGHTFIPRSAAALLSQDHTATISSGKKPSRTATATAALASSTSPAPMPPQTTHRTPQPKTFSHYVMNLPSTATDFLPAFTGLYAGHESLFAPHTPTPLPLIHCYCFGPKDEEGDPEGLAARAYVCALVSGKLGAEVQLEHADTRIWDVRDVAPKKRQFCASFRLPGEVAFRRV